MAAAKIAEMLMRTVFQNPVWWNFVFPVQMKIFPATRLKKEKALLVPCFDACGNKAFYLTEGGLKVNSKLLLRFSSTFRL